jgi:hypothetical protein
LHFDPDAVGGCVILAPDLAGRVDATALTISQRGGSEINTDGGWLGCKWPMLGTTQPVVAPGEFVIEDSSLAITGAVGDFLAPRTMTPVPDGPWTFAPQQTVVVRWSPAIDLPLLEVSFRRATSSTSNVLPATIVDDTLSFTLPAAIGMAQLDISGTHEDMDVPCSGARCSLIFVFARASEQLTIQ